MPFRVYDASMVATYGGKMVQAPRCWREENTIFRMLKQLKERKIDGILLDRFTYWRWTAELSKYGKKNNTLTTCTEIVKYARKKKTQCYSLNYKQCRHEYIKYFLQSTDQRSIPHQGTIVWLSGAAKQAQR